MIESTVDAMENESLNPFHWKDLLNANNLRANLGNGRFAQVDLYYHPSQPTLPVAVKKLKVKVKGVSTLRAGCSDDVNDFNHCHHQEVVPKNIAIDHSGKSFDDDDGDGGGNGDLETITHEYNLLTFIHASSEKEGKANRHIIQVYPSPRRDWLCMEALLGGSLHWQISQYQGLPIHTARLYTAELISALFHLASVNCIHRDIKANNILLTDKGHVKLADFNQSILLNDVKKRTYTLTGVAHAMAPEMAAGDIGYNGLVDWWALGVLLYEMLAAHPPPFHRPSSQKSTWPEKEDQELISSYLMGSMTNEGENMERIQTAWGFHRVNQLSPPVLEITSTECESNAIVDLEGILKRFELQQRAEEGQLLLQAIDFISKLMAIQPLDRLGLPQSTKPNCEMQSVVGSHPWVLFKVVGGEIPPEIPFDRRLGALELLDSRGREWHEPDETLVDDNLFAAF